MGDAPVMQTRPTIVLGSERSGTSVVAEMVHRWGCYAGEMEDLPAPDAWNARGRWEYQPLWDVLAAVGEFETGISWWEERFVDLIRRKSTDPTAIAAGQALVARMARPGGQPWSWKDPALCHFLPFWLQIWREPAFVITVRNPRDVASSWRECVRFAGRQSDIEVNLLRWQAMMLMVLRAMEGQQQVLYMSYEALMTEPTSQAMRLSRFLDANYARRSSTETMAAMRDVCDDSLWRQRGQVAESHATADQRRLYDFLLSKAHDQRLPQNIALDMPRGWREQVIRQEKPHGTSPVD